ncbi:hypothetical protein ABZP36_032596 [Zizania latifolia]
MQGVTVIYSKRGGSTTVSSHSEWLLSVPAIPDVIDVKLVPITSLIILYLRYKPPVADLKYFSSISACGLRCSVSCLLVLAPTGKDPARRCISACSVPSQLK